MQVVVAQVVTAELELLILVRAVAVVLQVAEVQQVYQVALALSLLLIQTLLGH
jgi:hypothetical protein